MDPLNRRRCAPAWFPACLLAFAVALSVPDVARAERADRDKPMALEADNARYDDLKQVYFLSGKAVLTKGTMVLKADTAEVRIDPEGFEHAVATGTAAELAFLRQKTENPNEYVEGYGERIEYDGKTQIAKLIGRARVKRLIGDTVADDVRGDVIVNDMFNSTYQATGSSKGGEQRVRAVLAPRKQAQGAKDAGKPGTAASPQAGPAATTASPGAPAAAPTPAKDR